MTNINDVWLEAQITTDGINLALLSDGQGRTTRVESVEHIDPDTIELQDGDLFTMNLSDETSDDLSEMQTDANVGRIMQDDTLEDKAEDLPQTPETEELLAYMGLLGGEAEDGQQSADVVSNQPQVGDVVFDQNAPDWSQDERVEVVEVLSDVRADEYVIQGWNEGTVVHPTDQDWSDETVADANPSYGADESVIIGTYVDGDSTEYAFPAGRLS